jgi:predicted RNA-binding Zn ribbon-like protein
MATPSQIDGILATSLHGNHLALNFVNTVDWRLANPVELLVDYEVVLHWALRLGVLTEERELARLVSEARRHPADAQVAHRRALELREALYRIFASLASDDAPPQDDLDFLNAAFADAVAHAALLPGEGGFQWSWVDTDPWFRVVRPVAAAAADLLFGGELQRVKQCRDEGCGWVFLDKSKNVSRRWCSMQGCGSRAKMRAQYRRRKARGRGEDP